MGKSAKAEVEVTASSKTLNAKLREARAKFATFGLELKKQVFGKDMVEKGFWGKGGATMVGNLGSSAVGAAANMFREEAASVYDFEDQLNRLQLAIRKSPEEMDAMRKSIRQVSTETGLSADTVLRAARSYVDLAGAGAYSTGIMQTIARAAQASGSDVGDLATVVYSLHNALKIPDEQMESTLSGLINQSKDGTVHFQQMAAEIIAIAPQFARFGVTGREGANQLGAMFQVIRGGSKDAAETSTEMQAIFRGLGLHAKNFEKAGVKIFDKGPDGVKHFRSIATIFEEIGKSKLAKDPSLLMKAFGRGDGEKAYSIIVANIAKMRELEEAAKANGTVQEDLAARQASSVGRIELAVNKAKNAAADLFTPERIEKFAGMIERLLPKLGKVAEFVSNAAGAIDHFYNGPSGPEAVNDAARDFVNAANTGNPEDEKKQIAQAKAIVAMRKPSELDKSVAEQQYGSFANYQAGAQKFLESSSSYKAFGNDPKKWILSARASLAAGEPDMTPWGDRTGWGGFSSGQARQRQVEIAASNSGDGGKQFMIEMRNLSDAIANLAKVGISISGDSIDTAGKKATTHRTRPRG